MHKILLALSILIVSCETTSQNEKPKIIPEPKKEIIYNPEKDLITSEDDIIEEETQINFKDFTGIKDFQYKQLNSLISKYGDFNFSKFEMYFEFHRYNAGKCRIFIQNNSDDKRIIQITIFNLENKNIYENYSKINCQ
tara:strand:- start:140 stop:553 length:414 start_codon:yes stop_codon:yes gene_type:complete